jgi:hypothetical protein
MTVTGKQGLAAKESGSVLTNAFLVSHFWILGKPEVKSSSEITGYFSAWVEPSTKLPLEQSPLASLQGIQQGLHVEFGHWFVGIPNTFL